ncbi:MAG: hypothetical protein NC218_02065 [Acetobacter sp.]|nr:hypothetical protein [Acetobacter sp.]
MSNKVKQFIEKMQQYVEATEYDITRDGQKRHCIRVLGFPGWYLQQCQLFGFRVTENNLPLTASAEDASGNISFTYTERDCTLSYPIEEDK